MLKTKLSRSALSLIVAVVLMFSLFAVGVFAETESEPTDVTETETDEAVESGDETEAETEAETEEEEDEKKGLSTFDIVTIIIFAVLIIVLVVYCLKNREKVGKFLRSLKSEFKKISWQSPRDVRKNTLVVLVVVIVLATVIAGLDLLFDGSINALKNIFG